jgi:hypothetical protein
LLFIKLLCFNRSKLFYSHSMKSLITALVLFISLYLQPGVVTAQTIHPCDLAQPGHVPPLPAGVVIDTTSANLDRCAADCGMCWRITIHNNSSCNITGIHLHTANSLQSHSVCSLTADNNCSWSVVAPRSPDLCNTGDIDLAPCNACLTPCNGTLQPGHTVTFTWCINSCCAIKAQILLDFDCNDGNGFQQCALTYHMGGPSGTCNCHDW